DPPPLADPPPGADPVACDVGPVMADPDPDEQPPIRPRASPRTTTSQPMVRSSRTTSCQGNAEVTNAVPVYAGATAVVCHGCHAIAAGLEPRSSARGCARVVRSDLHDEAVVGALRDGLVTVGQHLAAEVREDYATGVDPVEVPGKCGVVEVVGDASRERVGLADEEVGALGGVDEALAPLGVTGVDDRSHGPRDTPHR